MVYTQNLPRIDVLDDLARKIGPFPETAYHIGDKARYLGYSQEIIAFLRLFDPYHMFSSKREFLTNCEELEILISEAQHMPKDVKLSMED
jgi:hypothetical protein